MRTTLYVALDRKIGGFQINNDRVLLAKLVGDTASITALCNAVGVTSLCDFQSYDPQLLAEFVDEPEVLEVAIAKAKPIQWFEPSEALPVVEALENHFRHAPFIQERGLYMTRTKEWEPVDRKEDLGRELQDLKEVLSHAEKAGAKFRLYIGF
jgi:hypothetical protein